MIHAPSKRIVILQIFIIFVIPIIFLYFHIVPDSWRFFFLFFGALAIYGIIRYEHWTYKKMGIRLDNISVSWPYYLGFTILAIASLYLLDERIDLKNVEDAMSRAYIMKTLLLFLPISFFQEFAFRSFLIPRLKLIFNHDLTVILVNTLLFTTIHIIYPSFITSLSLAFVGGLFFTWLYLRHPNLVLISMAHAVVNVVALLLGFFSIH